MKTVEFKGQKYYLTSDSLVNSPLATKEQYENGEASYAHLHESGEISRYGKTIGFIADLKNIKDVKPLIPKVTLLGLMDNFFSKSDGWSY